MATVGPCFTLRRACCCFERPARPVSRHPSFGAGNSCFALGSSCNSCARALTPPKNGAMGRGAAPTPRNTPRPTGDTELRGEQPSRTWATCPRRRRLSRRHPLAPATQETLDALRDPRRRPQTEQVPLDADLRLPTVQPPRLSADRLLANQRHARRGAAAGPSGCTNEHLRVLLDDEQTTELLQQAAAKLARADVPPRLLKHCAWDAWWR